METRRTARLLAYYSPAMAPPRARSPRRRARRGSPERPVNARLVRGTWLLVALPLLVAAFTVARPAALPKPPLPPAFDTATALQLARELAQEHPDRAPGSAGALGATGWFTARMKLYGLATQEDRFTARVVGRGDVELRNVVAVVEGDSPQAIVVLAHRDSIGVGPGANDNASGTAALIELARGYSTVGTDSTLRPSPGHTLIFLSTDGGAFGALGAARFAAASPYRGSVVAVVNLNAIAGGGRARLELAGDEPRSPAAALVRTAAARVLEQTGTEPHGPAALWQLVDLGFPFAPGEQGPFIADGIPAVTLTTLPERGIDAFADTGGLLEPKRFGELGRAAQSLVASLDVGVERAEGTSSYLYLGRRIVRGWAVELVLLGALLPFLVGAVDLFAFCRRRRIRLAPALRALRSRAAFWAWAGLLVWLGTAAGLFRDGPARPVAPGTPAAASWPIAGLAVLALPLAAGWLLSRERLLPRRPVAVEERVAGYAVALVGLAVIALLVVATNPFALVFLLPSLYAWLWLPQGHGRAPWLRAVLFALGLAGPLLPVASLAVRYGLGLDAPAYLLNLVTAGYLPWVSVAVALGWAATAGQVGALAAGRYAPYPDEGERPPRGPLRETVRLVVLATRRRRNDGARGGHTGG